MAFSLFGFGKQENDEAKSKVVEVPLDQIEPNRYQPRKVFDPDGIRELAQTIDEHGLLEPIILREYEPAKYEIIAGERRYRAMKLLDWENVPAIVKKMSDAETASMALIENLQRRDLSSVEEAQAYQKLMELNKLTQQQLAKAMGKSQSTIANKLRLLKLIKPVQNAILDNRISERHGRALIGLNEEQQRDLLMDIVNQHWTVRQTEEQVNILLGKQETAPAEKKPAEQKAAKKKPAKKRRKRVQRHDKTSDPRIALNTIRHSIKLVDDSGIDISAKEHDNNDHYEIVITIAKNKPAEK
ncbi:MAG TPA: nucleoid occlusion protein [Candidatus Limosilactobacillus merdipullorum]|uniref:Nucleoid occlusion protein n=1 Tax=Candidatus Limosilactobacillus merdipullorum TaxID=2838653 RepID=A0A9D1QQM0_9LACO|nr:nucleoid occlusion protein [Candidatus Limosilactobacillus merdipullorum]